MNGSAGNNRIYRQWIAVGRIFLQAESTRKWTHPNGSRFDWCKLIAQVLKPVLQQRPRRRRFAEPGWRHQSDRMTAKSNHRRMDEIKIGPDFISSMRRWVLFAVRSHVVVDLPNPDGATRAIA